MSLSANVFYLIDLLYNLKILFGITMSALILIAFFVFLYSLDYPKKYVKKILIGLLIGTFISIIGFILLPNKDTCYEMVIINELKQNNIQSVEEGKDLINKIIYSADKLADIK